MPAASRLRPAERPQLANPAPLLRDCRHARYQKTWHAKIIYGGRDQLTALFADSGLRDETARRTAMLELVYTFRRFAHANVEADRHHKHDRKIGDQLDSPIISKLIELGQTSFDLLDKDASLLDEVTRNTLECARDKWEHMHAFNENFPDYDRNDTYKECCPIGGDFQIMEMAANEGVWALERKLDAMRFI